MEAMEEAAAPPMTVVVAGRRRITAGCLVPPCRLQWPRGRRILRRLLTALRGHWQIPSRSDVLAFRQLNGHGKAPAAARRAELS